MNRPRARSFGVEGQTRVGPKNPVLAGVSELHCKLCGVRCACSVGVRHNKGKCAAAMRSLAKLLLTTVIITVVIGGFTTLY